MENSKRIVRNIMIGIVLTAVVMGLVYYYHETQDESMARQGTLIVSKNVGLIDLWRQ